MCAPYTYIHVMHLINLWKNLQASCILHTVQSKKEHKNTTCSLLLGIVSQLNELHTIPSQIFTTYNSQSIGFGIHFTSSKGTDNNRIFLFQKCDTFGRTEKGRTWLTSQDHTDFTQLISRSPIKIHIIDSQKVNYLKYKAIAFSRNSPSVSVKPSVTQAEAS